MNSTATTTNWGYQATVGAAARLRWSAADAAVLGKRHHHSAIKPMTNEFVVTIDPNGIRHRPLEDSN